GLQTRDVEQTARENRRPGRSSTEHSHWDDGRPGRDAVEHAWQLFRTRIVEPEDDACETCPRSTGIFLPIFWPIGHRAVLSAPSAKRTRELGGDALLRKVRAPIVHQTVTDDRDIDAGAVVGDHSPSASVGYVDHVEVPEIGPVGEVRHRKAGLVLFGL